MCLQCHKNFPDAYVLEDMKENKENPQYEKWNTTSLSHCIIIALGANGKEAQKICREILDNYISWMEDKNVSNLEKMKKMVEGINKVVDHIESLNLSQKQIRDQLFEGVDYDNDEFSENYGKLIDIRSIYQLLN